MKLMHLAEQERATIPLVGTRSGLALSQVKERFEGIGRGRGGGSRSCVRSGLFRDGSSDRLTHARLIWGSLGCVRGVWGDRIILIGRNIPVVMRTL